MALDQFASIFGTDDAPDWETLKRRRELAKALAMRDSKHSHPLVQGFSDLGSGIGSLLGEMKLSAAEKRFMEKEEATPRLRGGVREPAPVVAPAATPAPAPARPAPLVTAPPPPAAAPGPQSGVEPDPNVDVVAEGDFNRLDAAAAPAAQPDAPALAWATEPQGFPQQRFDAAFAPTNEPVQSPVVKGDRLPVGNANQQVAERFPNEVPPAQEEQKMFAGPTATEPVAVAAPIRNPAPLADPSRLDPRLAAAIERHGGPYKDYLTQLAIKEANGKIDLVSKTGAAGPFQFTKGAAKQFELSNRFDPDESVKAVVRYTDHSANKLAEKGLPVTYSNFALMHQQGHGGGMNLLTGRGVSPRNLAVNNIDPRSSPDAARERVYKYYAYDDSAPTQTAQPAASPYQTAAVRPDPARSDLAQNVALDPQVMAEQEALPTGGQPVQTADSEAGSREMIAAALAGQQRPNGVQLASTDPARLGGITMPRAEPMGSMPLQQSMQNPAPPQAPQPPEISPDMLNSGASFLPGGGGMAVPDMSGPPPDPMLDPFQTPFNGASAPPAADAPVDAGVPAEQPPAVPVAPDVPAVPAPSEVPVRMAQAPSPTVSDAGGLGRAAAGVGAAAAEAPVWRAPRPPAQDFGPAPPVPAIANSPTPSYEPAPIPEIVPPPTRLRDIQPNDIERQLIQQATSPRLSPGRRAEAAEELKLEQQQRAREQAQQDAAYTSQLQQHVDSVKNRREYLEKLPRERLELYEKAVKAEVDKATLQNNPIARAKAVAELDEIRQVKIPKGLAETRKIEGEIEQQRAERKKKVADADKATIEAENARIDAERATEMRQKYGHLPPPELQKLIETTTPTARAAASTLATSPALRRSLEGNMITGAGADLRLDFARIKALFGDQLAGKAASDTETYKALVAPIVAYIIKDTVGGSQVSNTDREFAERAAGADVSQQLATLRDLLDIRDRKAREDLRMHGTRMEVVYGNNPNWQKLYGVEAPSIKIPESAVRKLRNDPSPEGKKEFNRLFGIGEDAASRYLGNFP